MISGMTVPLLLRDVSPAGSSSGFWGEDYSTRCAALGAVDLALWPMGLLSGAGSSSGLVISGPVLPTSLCDALTANRLLVGMVPAVSVCRPTDGPAARRRMTARDLLNSGLVGIWRHRSDIRDSCSFARTLRKTALSRTLG